jgi:hypothetical protein
VLPQDPSGIDAQLAIMEAARCDAAAWVPYPGFKPGFRLDTDIADRVIQKGLSLGVNLFCAHKGPPIGNFLEPLPNYPDDVGLWATDSITEGNPQPQIDALRTLAIPDSMQAQYGYPALTPEIKRKILGLSSAKLHGVDPGAVRCQVSTCSA